MKFFFVDGISAAANALEFFHEFLAIDEPAPRPPAIRRARSPAPRFLRPPNRPHRRFHRSRPQSIELAAQDAPAEPIAFENLARSKPQQGRARSGYFHFSG